MELRVKIFQSNAYFELENIINNWITSYQLNIMDIKLTVKGNTYIAMIIYKEVKQ